jgi:hypothetical protein
VLKTAINDRSGRVFEKYAYITVIKLAIFPLDAFDDRLERKLVRLPWPERYGLADRVPEHRARVTLKQQRGARDLPHDGSGAVSGILGTNLNTPALRHVVFPACEISVLDEGDFLLGKQIEWCEHDRYRN